MSLAIKGFYFLGDLLDCDRDNPIDLFGGYQLRLANLDEQVRIKRVVDSYSIRHPLTNSRYEVSFEKDKRGNIISNPLTRDLWSYWIIDYQKPGPEKLLRLSVSLSKLDLTILVSFDNGPTVTEGSFGYTPSFLSNFFDDLIFSRTETKAVALGSIIDLRKIYSLGKKFYAQPGHDSIKSALDDFLAIGGISNQSPFKIISYFSILEQLITTIDNDKRISSQLSKKIQFLENNEFAEKTDYKSFFKGPDSNNLETIVSLLYRYRSDIAHGNPIDFDQKLRVLKNQRGNLHLFLRELVKKVLLVALEKPGFILGLKEL
jgi:hypothetical protein